MTTLSSRVLWVLALGGCLPYSPPARALHMGAPGLIAGGQVEVGAALGGAIYPTVFVPHVSVGLTDHVAVEFGANTDPALGQWLMGWGGARLMFDTHLGIAWKGFIDAEAGMGFGLGGQAQSPRITPWHDLRARGGYAGAGVGMRLAYFGAFIRARLECSDGLGRDLSCWPSALLGVEARIAHHLVVGGAAGATDLPISSGGYPAPLYQVYVRYFFDIPR